MRECETKEFFLPFDCDEFIDPAINDLKLQKTLDENKKLGEKNMDDLIQHHVEIEKKLLKKKLVKPNDNSENNVISENDEMPKNSSICSNLDNITLTESKDQIVVDIDESLKKEDSENTKTSSSDNASHHLQTESIYSSKDESNVIGKISFFNYN